MSKQAEDAKLKGNECMKMGNYHEAILHYSQAIKLDKQNPAFYSNRSLAFLKIDLYFQALQDAENVILLNPSWPKGYFRKGEVEMKVQHYEMACKSYLAGLSICPQDEVLIKASEAAHKKLAQLSMKERRIPFYGAAGGLVVSFFLLLVDCGNKTSVLTNIFFKILLIVSFAGIGILLAFAYKFITISNRKSLLDEPLKIFDDGSDQEDAKPSESSAGKRKKLDKAIGKRRYRAGKSS